MIEVVVVQGFFIADFVGSVLIVAVFGVVAAEVAVVEVVVIDAVGVFIAAGTVTVVVVVFVMSVAIANFAVFVVAIVILVVAVVFAAAVVAIAGTAGSVEFADSVHTSLSHATPYFYLTHSHSLILPIPPPNSFDSSPYDTGSSQANPKSSPPDYIPLSVSPTPVHTLPMTPMYYTNSNSD